MLQKLLVWVFAKVGIYVQFLNDPAHIADIRDHCRPTAMISGFVVGTKNHAMTVAIFGKKAQRLYRLDRKIKAIKAHFDNEYTIREWDSLSEDDRGYLVVKQLFRYDVADDGDSRSEFAIVWTRLDRDKLHEYIHGLFYGCSCSYDCCGHWFTNLWTHKTKKFGPLAILFLGHGRNV